MENELNEEQRIQALLAAYVLGETTDEERAEVERLLAESEVLRAERARLEATIGLVQSTLGAATADEELSPASSAALADAIAVRKRATWYRSPVLQMAAGLAAVAVGFVGYRAWVAEGATGSSPFIYSVFEDGAVARAPKNENVGGRAADASAPAPAVEVAQELEALGYGGGGGGKAKEAPPSESRVARARLVDEAASGAGTLGLQSEGDPVVLGETLNRISEYERKQSDADELLRVQDNLKKFRAADVERHLKDHEQSEVALLSAAEAPAGGAVAGQAGYDQRNQPQEEKAGSAPPASDRPYQGPGDVVAPGTPSAPSSSGPTSPGPTARSVLAAKIEPQHAADDFFLGRGEAEEVDGETLERLGYVSDDPDEGDLGLRARRSNRFGGGRLDDDERLRRQVEFILGSCTRRPNEHPRDMFFRFWGDNPYEWPAIDPLSTFSVDVDTASYTLARRYLADGLLPEKAQVRTEEFVNYFDADVPAPLEETFAIATEIAPSRFGDTPDAWMLRIAVRGKEVSNEERQPLTLTFVIDVSGSMKENGRLELVKHALRLLLGQLDARDSISIVAFSKEARLILPMVSANNRSLIETAIFQLQPDGGTNAEAGLLMGYEQARSALTANSHNRVVLLSDGVANMGRTDQAELSAEVDRYRVAGIYLNTVGVGMNNHNDALLEQLANKGDGICNYVDDAAEAKRALVDRFTGAFEPIARDVKIQVEFDPIQVERYRLLGYENRAIADADFRNDAVDAGEVGAGHQVVALYELYGTPSNGEAPVATVRLRWKPPHQNGVANVENDVANEVAQPVSWDDAVGTFRSASLGYRQSVLVAQFAEFLRRSTHARKDSLDDLIAEAKVLEAQLKNDDFSEFVDMAERSHQLVLRELARYDDLQRALDSIRHSYYLQCQLEELNQRLGRDRFEELDAAARRLEERIEWMRSRVAANEFAIRAEELAALEAENARLREQVARLLDLLLGDGVKVKRRR